MIEKCRALVSSAAEAVRSHIKIALIIAGAFLIIIALLLVLAVVTHYRNSAAEKPEPAPVPEAPALSAEDFFLPYEPDFVPGVLLEREPREGWTEEDARPFWTDPMEGNEEAWRRRIESGIDALLERVP